MAIRHSITLSTTEPNNEIGVIKIRQADEQTQTLEVQITENGVPKSYQGLAVYFCAKLGQTAGLGIIEQKLKPEEMTNPANGKLEYTMRAEDWQILGRQKGYFSFRKMKDEHEFVEQFTTRDFTFDVIKSVFSDGLKEVKKDGSTYVWTIEDMLRLFDEYIASGKTDWEEFVEQNREVLESVDPGGKILGEIILARSGAQTLGERLDEEKAEVTARLQQTETQLKNMTYKRINVRDYGAKGDGVTDDSQAIINAIAKLDKNGGVLEFPSGVYLHGDGVTTGLSYESEMLNGQLIPLRTQSADVGRDIRFLFEGYKNLTILGNNSTILSHERNGETRNNAIFHFQNCENLKVYDIKVDGNIETRKPILIDYDDGTGKIWRSNINVITCRDVYFKNVVSSHSMLDGIIAFSYNSANSYNHVYENCVCNYNYRQGLTLSSVNDVDVIRGEYSYNATIYGTLPKSGIDVEADAHKSINTNITGVTFKGNEAYNLILSFRSTGIVVSECKFYDGWTLLDSPLNRGNILRNNKFHNASLLIAQEEVKVLNNEFFFDRPSTYFEIDWYGVSDKGGSYSEFSGNKIKCELPKDIDATSNTRYGLLRVDNAKTKIFNNEFIDVYTTKLEEPLYYAIRLIGYEVTDNKFVFKQSFDTSNTRFNISAPSKTYGNKITGYTEKEVVSVDFLTGYKMIKRFNLSVTTDKPITFELSDSRFFKLTAYDSANSHYEEKIFVFNYNVGSILGSQVISTINPSEVRKFESSASYDFTAKVLNCTITPSFTGTLYVDIESNSFSRNLNENSIKRR